MLDMYAEILKDVRTPERSSTMVSLAELLYETNYDAELDKIMTLVATNDSATEIVSSIEELIVASARSLLLRMGLDIHPTNINRYPIEVLNVLNAILTDVEEYDDVLGMLQTISGEEPPEVSVVNLTNLTTGLMNGALLEIIDGVDPKLMRVIRSTLVSRELLDETEDTIDMSAATRAATFIRLYPDNYVSELLDDNGYALPMETLVTMVDLDVEDSNYLESVALVVAGLTVAKHDDYDDAYTAIEGLVDQLLDPVMMDHYLKVCGAAHQAIEPIYATIEEVTDEQA